jgi:hypothetical protein
MYPNIFVSLVKETGQNTEWMIFKGHRWQTGGIRYIRKLLSNEFIETFQDFKRRITEEFNEEDDEEVDEASEEDDEDKVDEEFEDIAIEGDDDMPPMGGDPTDDLEGDIDADMGDEEGGEKSEEELFQDLDSIVDELQAKFDELKGGDHEEPDMDNMGGPSDMDADNESIGDLATVREYVEKVANGHGAEKKGAGEGALVGTGNKGQGSATNAQGMKFSKNDMGGTTANILSGRNGADAGEVGAAGGKMKGSALSDTSPKEDNAGNINVPGGKAGGAFSKKEPGHGAEKAGAKESPDNKQSLFRGRR